MGETFILIVHWNKFLCVQLLYIGICKAKLKLELSGHRLTNCSNKLNPNKLNVTELGTQQIHFLCSK